MNRVFLQSLSPSALRIIAVLLEGLLEGL